MIRRRRHTSAYGFASSMLKFGSAVAAAYFAAADCWPTLPSQELSFKISKLRMVSKTYPNRNCSHLVLLAHKATDNLEALTTL